MNLRNALLISVPLLVSAGVVWLGAQEKPSPSRGLPTISLTELAARLELREKTLTAKEAELRELESRMQTLQSTLDRDRQDLEKRENTLKEDMAKLQLMQNRKDIDPQIIRTYEAMEPKSGALALKELAAVQMEVAVALLGGMQPKKAAKLLDQLALLDAKLTGQLSEKVGLSQKKA